MSGSLGASLMASSIAVCAFLNSPIARSARENRSASAAFRGSRIVRQAVEDSKPVGAATEFDLEQAQLERGIARGRGGGGSSEGLLGFLVSAARHGRTGPDRHGSRLGGILQKLVDLVESTTLECFRCRISRGRCRTRLSRWLDDGQKQRPQDQPRSQSPEELRRGTLTRSACECHKNRCQYSASHAPSARIPRARSSSMMRRRSSHRKTSVATGPVTRAPTIRAMPTSSPTTAT